MFEWPTSKHRHFGQHYKNQIIEAFHPIVLCLVVFDYKDGQASQYPDVQPLETCSKISAAGFVTRN